MPYNYDNIVLHIQQMKNKANKLSLLTFFSFISNRAVRISSKVLYLFNTLISTVTHWAIYRWGTDSQLTLPGRLPVPGSSFI